jgi:hypothetical protein
MVAAAPYGDRRPLSTAVTTIPAEEETTLDLAKARGVLQREKDGADRMTRVLYRIQQAYGYLPWTAAELVAIEFGKTMTDVYTVASLLAIPRGGRRFTGNLAIAGDWPPQSPPPAHDGLHEDEVHHVVEPAYAR